MDGGTRFEVSERARSRERIALGGAFSGCAVAALPQARPAATALPHAGPATSTPLTGGPCGGPATNPEHRAIGGPRRALELVRATPRHARRARSRIWAARGRSNRPADSSTRAGARRIAQRASELGDRWLRRRRQRREARWRPQRAVHEPIRRARPVSSRPPPRTCSRTCRAGPRGRFLAPRRGLGAGSRAPSVNVPHGGALSGPFMNLYVAATGLIASATTDLL